jgi:hypothetical protein
MLLQVCLLYILIAKVAAAVARTLANIAQPELHYSCIWLTQ